MAVNPAETAAKARQGKAMPYTMSKPAFIVIALLTTGSAYSGVTSQSICEGGAPNSGVATKSIYISGTPNFGPQIVWQGADLPTVESSAIHIPLNFWLEARNGCPLTGYAEQATDEHVRQFLSIGVSAVGKNYGFNGSSCTYAIKRPVAGQAQGVPRGGLQQELVQYRVDVGVQCAETAELEVSTSTKFMKTLLSIDPQVSQQLVYKTRFTADVSALIYATKPDRVLFDVATQLQLQRQSKFAPRNRFAAFSGLDQDQIEQLRNDIRVLLVNAYAEALSSIGLSTEAAEPTDPK